MESSKDKSKVWIMLCVVCTVLMMTVVIALSVGMSEPVENIHMTDKTKAPADMLKDKTILGHPPSTHPKYECENCLDLNLPETLENLSKNGLTLTAGTSKQFYVTENPSTGYRWLVD